MRIEKSKKFSTLEEEILLLKQEGKEKALSIGEIFRVLSGKGGPAVLILLSLPFCQPLQIPGLSTPFGLVIAFFGLRMAFGKRIWLPERLFKKEVSSETLNRITDRALKLIKKMRRWIHPRLVWLCHSSFMNAVNGLIISLLGILLALPLPIPLSNLSAAWSILFIAFGILEDDGLFILIGYLLTLLTLAFLVAIAVALLWLV